MPKLSMSRFRPNIVVSGSDMPAFAEDGWAELQIGTDCRFEVAKLCSRCKVPRVDPWTSDPHATEPTATLKNWRTLKGKQMFGQNMVALQSGTVSIGDYVSILSNKDPPAHDR
jgi:uncharacterized protein